MLISHKQLKKVSVETQSGQFLGYVSNFELETDTGVIEKYFVRSNKLIAGILDKNLIINKSQIINFDQDKMIVDDAVVKVKAGIKGKLAEVNKLESTDPVVTAEES